MRFDRSGGIGCSGSTSRGWMWSCAIALAVLVVACAGSDVGNDAGSEEVPDFEDGMDGGWTGDEGASGLDADPGDDFLLVIPAKIQVCNVTLTVDAFQEYDLQGRVTFREVVVRLPREQESVTADIIDKVVLGPEGAAAVPKEPGIFTRSIDGTPDDLVYGYEYRQLYDLAGERCRLAFSIKFEVRDGVASDPVFVLDENEVNLEDFSGNNFEIWVTLGDGSDPMAQRRKYLTCDYSHLMFYEINVSVENGDRVLLDTRADLMVPCPWGETYCEGARSGWGRIARAVFIRGLEEQEVDGFFDLVFATGHHLFDTCFLVVLNEPVGSVHALYLQHMKGGQSEIDYLDAEFKVVDSPIITGWEPDF